MSHGEASVVCLAHQPCTYVALVTEMCQTTRQKLDPVSENITHNNEEYVPESDSKSPETDTKMPESGSNFPSFDTSTRLFSGRGGLPLPAFPGRTPRAGPVPSFGLTAPQFSFRTETAPAPSFSLDPGALSFLPQSSEPVVFSASQTTDAPAHIPIVSSGPTTSRRRRGKQVRRRRSGSRQRSKPSGSAGFDTSVGSSSDGDLQTQPSLD